MTAIQLNQTYFTINQGTYSYQDYTFQRIGNNLFRLIYKNAPNITIVDNIVFDSTLELRYNYASNLLVPSSWMSAISIELFLAHLNFCLREIPLDYYFLLYLENSVSYNANGYKFPIAFEKSFRVRSIAAAGTSVSEGNNHFMKLEIISIWSDSNNYVFAEPTNTIPTVSNIYIREGGSLVSTNFGNCVVVFKKDHLATPLTTKCDIVMLRTKFRYGL